MSVLQLWGLLIGAPSAHFWHAYLQKWFARKADTFETAIQKVRLVPTSRVVCIASITRVVQANTGMWAFRPCGLSAALPPQLPHANRPCKLSRTWIARVRLCWRRLGAVRAAADPAASD